MFKGRRDISKCLRGDRTFLLSEKRDILSSGEGTLYKLGKGTLYPQGSGPLILWDPGHPLRCWTMGNETAILWDSNHLSSGIHLLGSCFLGIKGIKHRVIYSVVYNLEIMNIEPNSVYQR